VNKLKGLNSFNNFNLHVVLAFVIATAIFVPISVYSEFLPGTILIHIDEKKYEIDYKQDGVDIQSVKPNSDNLTLIFQVEVQPPGELNIDFERSFFDSKVDGKDSAFFVLVDEKFYATPDEKSTPEIRSLMFDLPSSTKKIEIIGSFDTNLKKNVGKEIKIPDGREIKGPSSDVKDSEPSVVKKSDEQIMIDISDVTILESSKIPDWIRHNAMWWSEDAIEDSDFVSGIQYLIEHGVMQIPKTEQTGGYSSDVIPDWIKDNAGWWANGLISDDDFVNGIQYLVQQGIIKV